MSVFDGILNQPQARPVFGDVIAVHRLKGAYDHYGVYKDDSCVYEYAGSEGDSGDICVRISTLEKFIGTSGSCFVVPFPERYQDFAASRRDWTPRMEPANGLPPVVLVLQAFEMMAEWNRADNYRLFTPEETIARAHSRLGERKYSLPFNNCEHYAIWCKTGLSDSRQVDAVRTLFRPLVEEAAVQMSDPLFWYHAGGAVSSPGDSFADLTEAAAEKLRDLID